MNPVGAENQDGDRRAADGSSRPAHALYPNRSALEGLSTGSGLSVKQGRSPQLNWWEEIVPFSPKFPPELERRYRRRHRADGRRLLRRTFPLALALTLLCIAAAAFSPGSLSAPVPQFILLVFCYFLSGLRPLPALSVGMMIAIAYPASQFLICPLPNMTMNSILILSFNLMCLWGACILERAARENFLGRQRLKELALFDELTGLRNHRAFLLDLERLRLQARRERVGIAIAMIDVDQFKQYNDSHGHLEGDRCLRRIAAAIESAVRRPLDKAGRYGGDEFIIAWYDCQAPAAQSLAESLRRSVESLAIPQSPTAARRTVTLSIGIAAIPPTADAAPAASPAASTAPASPARDALIHSADRALYRAKAGGGNQVALAGENPWQTWEQETPEEVDAIRSALASGEKSIKRDGYSRKTADEIWEEAKATHKDRHG